MSRREILKATKLPSGGTVTTAINKLEQCRFIIKTSDIDKAKEDGLYWLVDEYTLFYFRFLNTRSDVNSGASLFNSNAFKIWSGYSFENICFRHHNKIAQALGISDVQYRVFSFVDKGAIDSNGAQIDMVIDRADNVINIIEIKFHNAPITIIKNRRLLTKGTPIHYAIFLLDYLANAVARFSRMTVTFT